MFGKLSRMRLDTFKKTQLGAQEPVKRLVTGGVIVAAVIVDFYRTRGAEAKSRAVKRLTGSAVASQWIAVRARDSPLTANALTQKPS